MKHLTGKTLSMNIDTNSGVNLEEVIKWFLTLVAAVTAVWRYVDYRFAKDKLRIELEKADKEQFIRDVAKAAVEGALNSVLGAVKSDIETLFDYREEDRKHFDKKFDTIILEMRK